jgi:hypothetical protein
MYFPWCYSVVIATSDSSILWMCSDWQLFALGTNGRTVGPCTGLHKTAVPQMSCDRASWHSAGNVWKVGQNNENPHWYIYSGAISIDQWLTTHLAPSFELTNHYTSQQLHVRKKDILRERGIMGGESEGCTDLNNEREWGVHWPEQRKTSSNMKLKIKHRFMKGYWEVEI